MNMVKLSLLMAIFMAMPFIFSCSSGDDSNNDGTGVVGGNSSSSQGSSSSSVGGGSSSSNAITSGGSSSSSVGGGSSSSSAITSGGSSSSSVGGGSSSSSAITGGGSSSSSVGGGSSSSSAITGSGSSSSSVGGGSSSSNAITYGGKTYKTVEIGGKVWMAENLNYGVIGSKCSDADGSLKGENTENCDKYGRLYNWATAMGLASSCNSGTCSSQIQEKHRGVCPAGWHIPSNAEWDALFRAADGTSGTSSPYNSPTAGKHLKAKEGWNSCGPSGSGSYSCEDTYGFAALPGGNGFSNSYYVGDAGRIGRWWSASEYNSDNAYYRIMYYDDEFARGYNGSKGSYLLSVRCLQD